MVLGVFILAAKPRRRPNTLLGLFFVIDAFGYAVFTLAGGYSEFPHKELIVPSHSFTILVALASAGLIVAAFWDDVKQLPQSKRHFVAALATGLGSLALTPMLIFVAGARIPIDIYGTEVNAFFGEVDSVAYGAYLAATAAVGAALLARIRLRPEGQADRARFLMASHLILQVTILVGNNVGFAANNPELTPLATGIFLVAGACSAAVALSLLGLGRVGTWSRWVPVSVMLASFAVATIELLNDASGGKDYGLGGIVTLVGLAGVAFALVRLNLLGVPLTQRRLRAGTLASVGLAALFITAQVAQNFLSDTFGLLIGGIVAGAVVFVAFPLQRAAERSLERRKAVAGEDSPAAKYRRLVETAWQDGKLGANERLLLSESMTMLGVDAETARRVDDDVARQHLQPKRRPT
ncbi:MAG: hypothetical protein AABX89_02185 [Candidatus Thermoplasmatota archaeon]